MSGGQQFCLRWNNHQPNFISVCSSLLHNGALVDVTLAAEGKQLQAHKIVLSACSSYFQSLFTANPCQHPIVILKDVQYNDLKTMVDFMYYGEVNVSQEQLPHILKTAEMLKIKGLAEMPPDAAAATLTKSDNKTEQSSEMHSGSSTNTGGSGTGCNSGTDTIWGQDSQQQFQINLQQHKRTPSPGINASPANRRKRVRKTSNNGGGGSIEKNSDEHSSLEQQMSMGQLGQMSFGGSSTNLTQGIHGKMIKDGSQDLESHHHLSQQHHHQHESSQESIDESTHASHHLHHIKPEADVVSQQLPLDIPDTPTPDEPPNVPPQTAHTGVQWTVVDSNYPRFTAMSSIQPNLIGANNGSNNQPEHDNTTNHSNDPRQQQQIQNQPQQHQHQQHQQNQHQQHHQQQQQHTHQLQMHYPNSNYPSQIIAVNSLVTGYNTQQQQQQHQNISTPTSPNDSSLVQSVYSQPTPTQSPVHLQQQSQQHQAQQQGGSSKNSQQTKRKRSVNPQGEECFIQALEAVKTGGIGFCKAARIYGVNNRTLWLEYKKRGYPISRPSIKSRMVKQENLSPSPTPNNDDSTMENYDHITQQQAQAALNMQVPPQSETPTPSILCSTPHSMNVMSFLDARHMEFPHTMGGRQARFSDVGNNGTSGNQGQTTSQATVNVNPTMSLQGINFNSI